MEQKLVLHDMSVEDIKAAEYNPRKLSIRDKKNLESSLDEFGVVEPLIVNTHKSRKNVLVGGHQRLRIMKERGYTSVQVVHVKLTKAKEKELNLRLNKNVGQWDNDKLNEFFTAEELGVAGFDEIEVETIFPDLGDSVAVTSEVAERAKPKPLEISPSIESTSQYLYIPILSPDELTALQDLLGLGSRKGVKSKVQGKCNVVEAKVLIQALQNNGS